MFAEQLLVGRSQFAIAAGSGASVATDILTLIGMMEITLKFMINIKTKNPAKKLDFLISI